MEKNNNTKISFLTLSILLKNLKKIQNQLKSQYCQIISKKSKANCEQILYDNYYIIDSKIKMLLKMDKKIKIPGKNLTPELGELIFTNIQESPEINNLKIIGIINNLKTEREIFNIEFDLLDWALIYIAIEKFYAIFFNTENSVELLKILAILTKFKSLDLDYLIVNSNPIEQIYSKDPGKSYNKMDKNTRNLYRNKTAAIAQKLKCSELEIALNFLNKARKSYNSGLTNKECDVGYWIFKEYSENFKQISPEIYVKSIIILPIIFSIFFAYQLNFWWLSLLVYFPIMEIIKTLIDYLILANSETTYLPRMNLHGNIPENAKTAIVISTIISNPTDAIQIQEKLRKMYFLNLGKNINYCILCDYKPSKLPIMPEDRAVCISLEKSINALNKAYGDNFIGIIRNRTYSKSESSFIGYERKRGAIEQLVNYIKTGNCENFGIYGNPNALKNIAYLAVLDYDTKPLMDTIMELISIATHPLNRPVISGNQVVSGYGILAPKITTILSSSLMSPFSRLFGGIGSSSAYDNSCGNLYQDGFSEGIFCGKGLIDVDTFYKICCDKFPQDKILSHDILEGSAMRTAFVGDIEFRDNFPTTAIKYFKRLHRWIRGDTQNLLLYNDIAKSYSKINRFKVFDNFRRAFTPIIIFSIPFILNFLPSYTTHTLLLIALFAFSIQQLISVLTALFNNGLIVFSKKYFSRTLSPPLSVITQFFYNFMLLPQQVVVSIDAIFRSIWRMLISHKKLLEWSTAAQVDNKKYSRLTSICYFSIAEILSICLIFINIPIIRLLSIIWALFPLLIFISDKPYSKKKMHISTSKIATLSSNLASMWQFYEDYANAGENFLPPDNVQFSPVLRICHRTSPTNIGMFLLSTLAARDFDLIDSKGLYTRVNRTLTAVKKLEKFSGNLYNWYETKNLTLSANPFVSSVDSGNLVCCLVALKEGLNDYVTEYSKLKETIYDLEEIINSTDLSIFYNKNINLFSIGIDPITGNLCENHYDMLMSEARMLSYFSIGKRIVPKNHWITLQRAMKKKNGYSGSVSYSGTMFEFFMPELLLKSDYGSLMFESLKFCIYCQKSRAKEIHLPFGVSESAYYAFDNSLNYQYKAHGVQNLGIKRGLDKEYIVSPYSTYLALPMDINGSISNLQKLNGYGLMGHYGYYEAIDFTNNSKTGSIIKNYMAHHVGMSIISIANVIHDNSMKTRFMRDNFMDSANELLEEKMINDSIVFDEFSENQSQIDVQTEVADVEYFDNFSTVQPNVKLLFNGGYTCCVTDLGATISLFHGNDVFVRPTDLTRRPQGAFFAIQEARNTTHFTFLPNYTTIAEQSSEFEQNCANFYTNSSELELGMRVFLHQNLPCEFREFAVKNLTSNVKRASLLAYLEPIMMNFKDFESHPAFAKLLISIEYDEESQMVIISRKDRNSANMLYCAIGFIGRERFSYNFSREDVLNTPDGVASVFTNTPPIINNMSYIPDPCVFMKLDFELNSKEQNGYILFVCCAIKLDELYQNVAEIREEYPKIGKNGSTGTPNNSIEKRISNQILPQILFNKFDGSENAAAISSNNLPITSLWGLSISGDNPIVCIEVFALKDEDRISAYLKCHTMLKISGIIFDLVFIFDDKNDVGSPFQTMLKSHIRQHSSVENIGMSGGLHLINSNNISAEIRNLLFAVSCHIAPKSMIRMGIPVIKFNKMKICPIEKLNANTEKNWEFTENGVKISSKTSLPWCHILANPVFGTLVSNGALGFSYAVNSRENKLTPWFNDTQTDNRGEMLLIKIGNRCYDLLLGSEAVFTHNRAVFTGTTPEFTSTVTVSVAKKGFCKKISLEIRPKNGNISCKIAYYTEPVLGVSRNNSRLIKAEIFNETLILTNPANPKISGFMGIKTTEKFVATTNREAFLSGDFTQNSLSSQHNLCGAIIVNKSLKAGKKSRIDFYLSFGKTKESAVKMPDLFTENTKLVKNSISITTKDKNLNNIFNNWLYTQTISGRIFGKTGFYQNSGAYGFRDQLQDCCAAVLQNPELTKRQIFRACSVQFVEGDVLHWWHRYPNSLICGVRTRYSDDLLWLPYTVNEYIEKTSDYSILSVNIAYSDGPVLSDNQHENYLTVTKSNVSESVYSHCIRAIEKASCFGEHGINLMGGGDWNDGFNRVGEKGSGESVWLSEFFSIILRKFSKISLYVGQQELMQKFQDMADEITVNLEKNCWDGEWYLRAFFDNGKPLGSSKNSQCKIDSLSQSFAILANLPNKDRNYQAINSAFDQLVDVKNGIIKLFTPPFSGGDRTPGYITTYPPGVRENGGQYTHGAIWLCIALLEIGEIDKGFQLIQSLNPANKYPNNTTLGVYKNEPYAMSADIYTNPLCYGRGGWSIYTGAAGWYYRAIFEWFLGIKVNKTLKIQPKIPESWDGFTCNLNYNNTKFTITVKRGDIAGIYNNGVPCQEIEFDEKVHVVDVII